MQSYVLQKGYKMAKRQLKSQNYYNALDNYDYSTMPQKQKRNTKKRKPKVLFVKAVSAKNQSFSVYIAIILLFLMGLGVVIAGSNVTLQRNINNSYRNQLSALETSNIRLYNQINQARNLEDIEYMARNNLNMSEPLSHQITAINVIEQRELVHDFNRPPIYTLTFRERVEGFFTNMFSFFTGE